MKRFLCFFILTTLLITGCASETISNANQLEEGTVLIKPSSLFEGIERLQPHLNMQNGCVEVFYKGNKKFISTKYEIWEKGKLKESYGNFKLAINNEFHDIIGISLKESILEDFSVSDTMTMITAIGQSNVRGFIDRYPKSYDTGSYNIYDEIKGNDDDEIAIWGLIANEAGSMNEQKKSIEETAKIADWAFVVKVYFE